MKSNINVEIQLFTIIVCVLATVICQDDNFVSLFSKCHMNDPKFDSCIRDALNGCRQYFKTGLPQYGVTPFDPFFAKEVPQKMGVPNLNYTLLLKDVFESGWTISEVTEFKSNFNKNMIQYTQFFPVKKLNGDYEIIGNIFGGQINNQGSWNLTLYDFVQTTTITRKPRQADNGTLIYDTPLKVNVNIQTCKNLKLHISNLLGGSSILENMLDQIINNGWQLGYPFMRPIINDLVSTGFTGIFTKSFQYFPFNEIIH